MAKPNDSIAHLSVRSDSLDEAAQFIVGQLQGMAVDRGARGFLVPVLTQESFELFDGEWARAFEFSSEFLAGA